MIDSIIECCATESPDRLNGIKLSPRHIGVNGTAICYVFVCFLIRSYVIPCDRCACERLHACIRAPNECTRVVVGLHVCAYVWLCVRNVYEGCVCYGKVGAFVFGFCSTH